MYNSFVAFCLWKADSKSYFYLLSRWAPAADALVGHIAAAITIAYEEARAPNIRIALQVCVHI